MRTTLKLAVTEKTQIPAECSDLEQLEPIRAANVTWKKVEQFAGNGWMIVGDAAYILDPSSSHGVLKVMTSGMMAAHALHRVFCGEIFVEEMVQKFSDWMEYNYLHDLSRLQSLNLYGNI